MVLITLPFYFIASIAYAMRVISNQVVFSRWAYRCVLLLAFVHPVLLAITLIGKGYPFLLGRFEILQVVSWATLLIFMFFRLFYRFSLMGVIFVPTALIVFLLSLTGSQMTIDTPFLNNPWALIHLATIVASMSIFLASFIIGLIYLRLERRLKHKQFGGFWEKLPSLADLEKIHDRSLYTGFVLFTLGIIAGAGWSKSAIGVYVSTNAKQLVSLGAWVFYALFFNLKVPQGWNGRKGILLSSIGFLTMILVMTMVL